MDSVAKALAESLKGFPFRAAVVGGSSVLWQVPPAFDVWAEAARRVVRDRPSLRRHQGIPRRRRLFNWKLLLRL